MRHLTRFEIQEDLAALTAALLDERFLKDDDPSIAIMNFIENISNEMGAIKHLYSKGAKDRNEIIAPVREKLGGMRAAIDALEQSLNVAKDDPEDTNDELPTDAES